MDDLEFKVLRCNYNRAVHYLMRAEFDFKITGKLSTCGPTIAVRRSEVRGSRSFLNYLLRTFPRFEAQYEFRAKDDKLVRKRKALSPIPET